MIYLADFHCTNKGALVRYVYIHSGNKVAKGSYSIIIETCQQHYYGTSILSLVTRFVQESV